MDNERDRRDWTDPSESPEDPFAEGTRPEEPLQPDEPVAHEEPMAAAPTTEPASSVTPEATASAAEIESWPSQESAETARPVDETRPWPTEPPAAGEAAPDAWPTSPPERSDELASMSEPPPGEVEAYPAEPVATSPEADDSLPEAGATGAAAAAHSVPDTEAATGESTQCPRCGTENRPGLAFCRNCGQRLVAAGVSTTVERPGAPEGTMACPRCGTHNRQGVAFCQNCGANLRGTSAGYVPPAVADSAEEAAVPERRGAILGPVVLLIGLVGLITAYLLPFAYGTGSLFERAFGSGGYGAAFWAGYPDVAGSLADQAYFGLAAPAPLLGLLLLALAVAGFVRAVPGALQTVGLIIALLWSVGLVVLFVIVELAGNWSGDLVGMLRALTPAGIIFFLSGLIILIGTLTRFGRS